MKQLVEVGVTVFAMKLDVVDFKMAFPYSPEIPYVTESCSKWPGHVL
jgi:hypothetical protein